LKPMSIGDKNSGERAPLSDAGRYEKTQGIRPETLVLPAQLRNFSGIQRGVQNGVRCQTSQLFADLDFPPAEYTPQELSAQLPHEGNYNLVFGHEYSGIILRIPAGEMSIYRRLEFFCRQFGLELEAQKMSDGSLKITISKAVYKIKAPGDEGKTYPVEYTRFFPADILQLLAQLNARLIMK